MYWQKESGVLVSWPQLSRGRLRFDKGGVGDDSLSVEFSPFYSFIYYTISSPFHNRRPSQKEIIGESDCVAIYNPIPCLSL